MPHIATNDNLLSLLFPVYFNDKRSRSVWGNIGRAPQNERTAANLCNIVPLAPNEHVNLDMC